MCTCFSVMPVHGIVVPSIIWPHPSLYLVKERESIESVFKFLGLQNNAIWQKPNKIYVLYSSLIILFHFVT